MAVAAGGIDELVLRLMHNDPSLSELRLAYNYIGDAGATGVGKALMSNAVLQKLASAHVSDPLCAGEEPSEVRRRRRRNGDLVDFYLMGMQSNTRIRPGRASICRVTEDGGAQMRKACSNLMPLPPAIDVHA